MYLCYLIVVTHDDAIVLIPLSMIKITEFNQNYAFCLDLLAVIFAVLLQEMAVISAAKHFIQTNKLTAGNKKGSDLSEPFYQHQSFI
ncbi:hypothetical protein [Snodgrassella sp.]|uniref:hypothetical protein n=1 Tax=Snodgrassella sp. TaxID=2815304 RepID=UPI00258C4FDF|nr:hypothetical protein [Snodgrassella sp.]